MDVRFCARYRGDGSPPSNRFCRSCPFRKEACNALWERVIVLSRSNGGEPVALPPTRALLFPHRSNPDFVRMRINCTWTLPVEDFLYFIATGHAGMGRKGQRQDPASSPSMTRQEPYVQAIVEALGGWEIPEIARVKKVQQEGEPGFGGYGAESFPRK
jgi:hypothetical protein